MRIKIEMHNCLIDVLNYKKCVQQINSGDVTVLIIKQGKSIVNVVTRRHSYKNYDYKNFSFGIIGEIFFMFGRVNRLLLCIHMQK